MASLEDAGVSLSALHFQLHSSPSPTNLLRTLSSSSAPGGLAVHWSSVAGVAQPSESAAPNRIGSGALPPPSPGAGGGDPHHHVPLPVLYLGKAWAPIPAGR